MEKLIPQEVEVTGSATRIASRVLTLGVAALGSTVLVAHAWSYLSYVTDDALISLRYARRLLDGRGLTWTDGERVEGYSNLLWVSCAPRSAGQAST